MNIYPKIKILKLDDSTSILLVKSTVYGDQECLIDNEDIDKVSQYSWNIKAYGHDLYYAHAHTGTSTITLHRLVLGFPKGIIDHIDGNCLDNRKSNLRVVSYSENRRNSSKQRNTKCKYRGVYERKEAKGKYRAQIRFSGKIINLGTFKCEIEAAKVYDKAAIQYYGEFAVTNF